MEQQTQKRQPKPFITSIQSHGWRRTAQGPRLLILAFEYWATEGYGATTPTMYSMWFSPGEILAEMITRLQAQYPGASGALIETVATAVATSPSLQAA